MPEKIYVLGIDCGGTHTDAALLEITGTSARLLASAKTETLHDNLPLSIKNALTQLGGGDSRQVLALAERITIGTTLEINALVQGKADRTALALAAGPGLDPIHFILGDDYCIVPGGLDHRGVEVSALYTQELAREAKSWQGKGVAAVACVGKFSPRNPAHEKEMAHVVEENCVMPVTMGHSLSGKLNFPRRIATAYYNAAVSRLHGLFLDSLEEALEGTKGQTRLLKADGGAIAFAASRREPVQSILSGPAASVMGSLALWPEGKNGCSLLLDMGGTTTDIALILDGSPVIERDGMEIKGRRTLVRSLASISIPVGGDSLLSTSATGLKVRPTREGPAMAFGGKRPTLLDALNFINPPNERSGDFETGNKGIEALAAKTKTDPRELAMNALKIAMDMIMKAIYGLVERINAKPIYTLAALKAAREARPERCCLVGGPAQCIRRHLAAALGMAVSIPPDSEVANAIGAALARPTASLEIFADTARGEMWAPAIRWSKRIPASITLEEVKTQCAELLTELLAKDGISDARVECVEADLFATLDDRGRGAKDMRATCQAVPGITASLV